MENPEQQNRLIKIGSRLVIVAALVAAVVAISRNAPLQSDPPAAGAAQSDPITALELRTREKPDDAEAWSALASGYFDRERYDDAVTAYGSAIKLLPVRAALWSARGESRVMASRHDPMPVAAIADFEKAVGIDPKDPRGRYFLAVRQDIAGDHQGAIDNWLALLADTPPGAVWEEDLRRTIEQVGKINGIATAERLAAVRQPPPMPAPMSRPRPGPSAEELSRAASIPPSEQRRMAEGMVSRLKARLRNETSDVDGWIMLIRSHMTLGQSADARSALAEAVAANPGQADRLRQEAAMLGVR